MANSATYLEPLKPISPDQGSKGLQLLDQLQLIVLGVWASLVVFTEPTFSSLAHLVMLFFFWLFVVVVSGWHVVLHRQRWFQALKVAVTIPLVVISIFTFIQFKPPPWVEGAQGWRMFMLCASAYPGFLVLRWLWRMSINPADATDPETPSIKRGLPILTARFLNKLIGVTLLLSLFLCGVFLGLIEPFGAVAENFEGVLHFTAVTCVVTTALAIPFSIMRLIRSGAKLQLVWTLLGLGGSWLALGLIYALIVIAMGSS